MANFSVAIMAGGKSSRMGTNKAFVPLLGKSLIEHILERLSALGANETFIVTNQPENYAHLGFPTHRDIVPGRGPLGGIHTALHMSAHSDVLVIACDMPFVNANLLRYMILLRGHCHEAIVPRKAGYPQGLHAIYNKRCLDTLQTCLQNDHLKVIRVYEHLHVHYLDEVEWQKFDPAGLSFFNVNTPEDLVSASRLNALSEQSDHNEET